MKPKTSTKKIIKRDGLPFEVNSPKPNKELLESLQEVENMKNGKMVSKGYYNVQEMFGELDNEISCCNK